jgi:phosphohistidine phosphatase
MLRAVIWLVRHTEAEDGSPDAERKLTAKGEQDARTIASALVRLGVEADGCVASPKVRARETARPVCEALGHDLTEDERLAGGPFDPHEVAGTAGENAILVGHEPDLSMAVHRMTGAQVRLPKGAVVGVDRGELKVLLRPEELRALAGAD